MKALFVSRSVQRAGWYRCVLPAMWGNWDWAAIDGDPPKLNLVSSWVESTTKHPNFFDYDVIVLEMVGGKKWAQFIRMLRKGRVKVLYEIDDYVHGIRQLVDHDFAAFFSKDHVKGYEECMRECDGIIVSTEFLAERYRRFSRDRPIWVCENGLDMGRYRLTRPERGQLGGRETVTVLWSGATGHQLAVIPWLEAVKDVMRRFDHVSFASIGQDFAALLHEEFPDRVISVPFSALPSYPSAMMLGDISIAPTAKSEWGQAKSDLRAMESAALGIPIVADKHYARSVLDGETGFVVGSEHQVAGSLAALIEDDDRRTQMSERAREFAHSEFSMDKRIEQWSRVLTETVSGSV